MPPEWVEPQGGQTVEHHESSDVHPAQVINAELDIGVAPSDQVALWALSHPPPPPPLSVLLPPPPPHQYGPSHLMEITETDNVTDPCPTGTLILLTSDPARVYRRSRLPQLYTAKLPLIMSVPIHVVPEQLGSLLSIGR